MNGYLAPAAALVAFFGLLQSTSAVAGEARTANDGVGQPWSTGVAANARPMPETLSRASAAAEFDTVFDCDGSILHQSVDGEIESSLSFWFGVRSDNAVEGAITEIGSPLALPVSNIVGELTANHDFRNEFIGGKLSVHWPHSKNGKPVELALMRETYVRVGPRVNGISKIKRHTSNHTYIAGRIQFDPESHPQVASFRRIAFITATCFPTPDLPAAAVRRM